MNMWYSIDNISICHLSSQDTDCDHHFSVKGFRCEVCVRQRVIVEPQTLSRVSMQSMQSAQYCFTNSPRLSVCQMLVLYRKESIYGYTFYPRDALYKIKNSWNRMPPDMKHIILAACIFRTKPTEYTKLQFIRVLTTTCRKWRHIS